MLNPEPPPPPMMVPPATPMNRETTSLRKKNRLRTRTRIPPFDVDSSFFTTPISLQGTTKSNAISVEQYDGVSASASSPVHVINLSDTEDDDEVRILNFTPINTSFGKRSKKSSSKGECSNSASFVCEICTETKTARDSFSIIGCHHVYCNSCVAQYVESKLEENIVSIPCPVPGCRGLLEADDCREILAPRVFDRWGKALCEAVIAAEEKFYCPFADCSVMLIRGIEENNIREAECPNCRRLFCAQCRVPWHDNMPCEDFQKLNADERDKEDIMLMNLANQMQWKRCPRCRFYVAKSDGCMYMKCRGKTQKQLLLLIHYRKVWKRLLLQLWSSQLNQLP
ncbi:ATP-dependent RNA helicase DEAH12, chloroplastic isoform B [Glycine soja]|uniref:RBR-type E3 ubiquitin transferase n=1 Tax=Glycine soja TaxID=3848 RepID=A0A445IY30_GLYSO|nr:ATP-dependent RNA helicase DEAH12, chloroplastic isoform B [Glycine soja]